MGPRVNGAFSTAVFAEKLGESTEVTVWPEPTQRNVTVPPRVRTTVSGLKREFRTSMVASDTGGGGGGGGPGGGGGAGGGLVTDEPPQASRNSAIANRFTITFRPGARLE